MALKLLAREALECLLAWRFGGWRPQLCLLPAAADCPSLPSTSAWDVGRIAHDFGIVFGVPKHKTGAAKIRTRRFGKTKLWYPAKDLISCQECGSWHQLKTICGVCYAKVREETLAIKERMLNYDPHIGETPDKSVVVVYKDDEKRTGPEFWHGKRIIERPKERPKWFPDVLRSKLSATDTNGDDFGRK